MEESNQYDALIIGAGQGGVPLATELADRGWSTALIERHYVGGSCINYGCTPTKTLIASGRVAHLCRRASEYGIRAGPVEVDMAAVRQRKRDVVESARASNLDRIESSGAELIRGEARFVGARKLVVELSDGSTRSLDAEKIFIDTGSRPRIPDLAGLESIAYLDSTAMLEVDEVPRHLLVLGGGYVGVEFGQMFRRFGSRVTIVQRGEQLLSREDPDVAEELTSILEEDGVEVVLEAQAVEVAASEDSANDHRAGNDRKGSGITLTVEVGSSGKRLAIKGSHLLIAAGRTPNTEVLDLAAVGIETDDRGYIRVDERLATSQQGVYALGDVNGGPAFTHISYDDYRIVRTNLLEDGGATTGDRLVPYTLFTDPELGRVGLTERQAQSRGLDYQVASIPMTYVSRARETGETRGLMKALVDSQTQRILGVAVLAVHGGELMSMLELAMMGDLPYAALQDGVFAHPTLAESLNTLFSSMD